MGVRSRGFDAIAWSLRVRIVRLGVLVAVFVVSGVMSQTYKTRAIRIRRLASVACAGRGRGCVPAST